MAKLPIKPFLFLGRSYAVVAETVRVQGAATKKAAAAAAATEQSSNIGGEQKEVFWMRDPNTGNWIPETHFADLDVADLREKLLPKKKKL